MGFSLSRVILRSRVSEYLQLSDALICNLEHCCPPGFLPPCSKSGAGKCSSKAFTHVPEDHDVLAK